MVTAHHRELRAYATSTVDPPLIVRAAGRCRFKVLSAHGAAVHLSAGFSFWSFGERIEVALLPSEGAIVIDVSSRCRWPLQIEDWGKNRRNVRRLLAELDAGLQGPGDWQPVPVCHHCEYLLWGTTSSQCPECGAARSPTVVRPSGKKSSLRVALVFALGISAVEIVVELALSYARVPNPLSIICAGQFGYLRLLALNLLVTSSIIAAARIVRWIRR